MRRPRADLGTQIYPERSTAGFCSHLSRGCARIRRTSENKSGVVRKIVKGYRVEAMDNKSNLRGLGMERLRESLIKTPLPFVVKGGVGGGDKLINIGFAGKGEFKRMVRGVSASN